jgi:hypothetical protein
MNFNTVTVTVGAQTWTGWQVAAVLGGICFFGFVFLAIVVGVAAVMMRRGK